MPGYGESYSGEDFSVLILDADQKMYAWYEGPRLLFSRDSKLVIGHFSPHYYVVLDGVAGAQIPSVNVSVAVQAFPDSQPRTQ